MKRFIVILSMLVLAAMARPESTTAQTIARPVIGGTVGVFGGGVITLSAIVARARFKREYVESADDLIHWQSIPMILTPAVGVMFGLAGDEALKGSVIGSTSGMVVGAAAGAGLGYLMSEAPEWPWAAGVIGAGVGLTLGGIYGGLRGWKGDDAPSIEYPEIFRFGISVPIPH